MRHKKTEFRGDIAGLRALAVMLVVFSHFEIPYFQFGFIGVDIFFVISGFLITRILYKDYLSDSGGSDKTSALGLGIFYLRRVRRLLPAALVTIFAVNLISFFLFNPESRESLLSNSKWALFFLANVAFLRSESDYFQQTNEPSMLQHYWSLSVEEQFYFIWPLLFLIAASFQRIRIRTSYLRFDKRILGLIALVSLLSFVYLQNEFRSAPTEAYFSIFSRAWELGIGSFVGILAFHKKQTVYFSRREKYTPLIFAILLSFFAMRDDNWAKLMIIPVVTVAFVLYAGQNQVEVGAQNSRLFRLLRRPTLYVGAISYSLYLIHWPLYILARHLQLLDGLSKKLGLIAISIILAHLLCKYVEKPFQKLRLPKQIKFEKTIFNFVKSRRLLVGSVAFIIVGSLYVVTYPSVSGRLIYSEGKLADISRDPLIKEYSDYQNNLVNSSGNSNLIGTSINSGDSASASSMQLPQLIAQQVDLIRNGIKQEKLTASGIKAFAGVQDDRSPFEQSNCQKQDSEKAPDCSTRGSTANQKKVALIGDSKMGQFAQPLIDYFSMRGWKVVPYVLYGCNILAPDNTARVNCTKRAEWVKNQLILEKFNLVIGAVYPTSSKFYAISDTNLNQITSASEITIWLTQFTRVGNPKDCIKADFSYPMACSKILANEQESYLGYKSLLGGKANKKLLIIDTTKWTCVEFDCPIAVGDIFLTRDGSHLSYSFVKRITPLINSTLDSIGTW